MPRLLGRGRVLQRLRSWTWLVMVWALLCLALWLSQRGTASRALVDAPLLAYLDWRPLAWQTQPWRLWTAALVHWSASHLGLNLLGCAALIAWGNAAALGQRQTLAWCVAWPVTHWLLASDPSPERYGGLSGVLHAGVAVGAWALAYHGQGQRRLLGCLVLAGLVLKQAFETPLLAHALGWGWVPLVRALPGAPHFAVATYAHGCGVVAGVACASTLDAIAYCWSADRAPKPRR